MPIISGFHALTYDAAIDLSEVVSPPYDVIDPGQRERLARRHRHNFVAVDLPQIQASGQPQTATDRYRAAADLLTRWRHDNILRRDPEPVLYRYDQVFTHPERGHQVTRRGVLAAVALSPWTEGIVRPHERTLTAPREDRARLLEVTRTHLSPVFAAYDDPEHRAEALFATAAAPDRSATTDDGTLHKLWRIADPAAIARWSALLRDKPLYVLDGHHRYETMVASGATAGLMFLVASDEPGLVVLPTHRVVHGLAALAVDRFLAEAARDCEVHVLPGAARDAARLRTALDHATRPTFAAVFADRADAYVLQPRDATDEPDVAVLHDRILGRALEATAPDAAALRLRYVSNTQLAIDQPARGEAQLALLLRPPTLAQIQATADAGRVMPQKSTYFFPKLASGLALMPLE